MKRRSFLQWILGVLGTGAVEVPKVKATNTILSSEPQPKQKVKWSTVSNVNDWEPKEYTAIYVNRQFRAEGRRIKWSKEGVKENMWIRYDYDECDYIDLPNFDACEDLFVSEDCLLWLGGDELWKIEYTGDIYMPFTCKFLGIRDNYLPRRIGYRVIN